MNLDQKNKIIKKIEKLFNTENLNYNMTISNITFNPYFLYLESKDVRLVLNIKRPGIWHRKKHSIQIGPINSENEEIIFKFMDKVEKILIELDLMKD